MIGVGRGVAVLLAFTTVMSGSTGQAAVILDSLLVRVYDNAGVLTAHRARAIKSAHEIISSTGLDVVWHDCPAKAALIRSACATAPAGGDVAVRFVRSPKRHPRERALGHAFIDTATGAGTLATVFIDRVEALAAQGHVDQWALVGRVMAHELGHLLLGTNAHSDVGLMREIWSVKELTRNRPEDWLFSSPQRDELRVSRLARNAPAVIATQGGTPTGG